MYLYNYNLRKPRNEQVQRRAEMESESASRVDQMMVWTHGKNARAPYGVGGEYKLRCGWMDGVQVTMDSRVMMVRDAE